MCLSCETYHNQIVDHNYSNQQDSSFVNVKKETHLYSHGPSNDNHQWSHQQCNLHAAPHSNAQSQIHLVLESTSYCRQMLCCIAHNRNEDKAYKGLTNVPHFGNFLNSRYQEFCTNTYNYRNNDQSI